LQLVKSPSAQTGMLIRRASHDVFEALADPSITTRFWYTKSSGRMEGGAELAWEGYDPAHPTTVEFLFVPYEDDATYVRITETGFRGDGDTQVSRALDSTGGFTFLLSSLKAALEHDITLKVTLDAHPPNLQLPA
jgi:uncharacterized protein YndB with AHSA1/START domain